MIRREWHAGMVERDQLRDNQTALAVLCVGEEHFRIVAGVDRAERVFCATGADLEGKPAPDEEVSTFGAEIEECWSLRVLN
jgi:hypothetical protein